VDVNPDAGVAMTIPTYAAAAAPTPPTTNTHINFRRMFHLLVYIRSNSGAGITIGRRSARCKP
jgi:hypothetical protein